MAIIKSGLKVSRNNSHSHTQSSSSTDDELKVKENHPYQDDSGAESDTTDESDVAEVGSELCMVGDQTCSVPYELFDLPDLKKVLSLDVWNSELTDEDRYNLSAYLPDMDQQTFNVTLKELLGGEILYLKSPMAELFNRLKGGLCTPKVSRYREGLQYLQKKEHYHNLRKYHNNMVNTFHDMRKVWKTCPPGAAMEEKIRTWNNWINHKKFSQAEPQALPPYSKQGEASRKGKHGRPPTQSTKKSKTSKYQAVADVVFPPYQTNILTTTKADGKGVLKLKAPTKSSFPSESSTGKLEYKETLRTPKGVLKITPKSHARQEQSQMKHDGIPFSEMEGYEGQVRPSLHSQAIGGWEGDNYIGEASFVQSKSKDRKKRNNFEVPEGAGQQAFDYYSNSGPGKSMPGYDKKLKKVREQDMHNMGMQMPVWYGQDSRNFEEEDNLPGGNRFVKDFPDSRRYMREGGMFNEETPYADQHWRHIDKPNREYQRSSMEHYANAGDWRTQNFHQPLTVEHQMNYNNRELDLEGPANVHGEQNIVLKSMEKSKKKRKEARPSLEDSFRLSNERRNLAEDHSDKHDYFKEQPNFLGNRRYPLDSSGLLEEAKWSDQGKFLNEHKRRKQSQIGDVALDLGRNFEEPMVFEGTQSSKKSKRKRDHEKGESMDFFAPQAIKHEYEGKRSGVKIKFKTGAKTSDVLTDANVPQDRTQSS